MGPLRSFLHFENMMIFRIYEKEKKVRACKNTDFLGGGNPGVYVLEAESSGVGMENKGVIMFFFFIFFLDRGPSVRSDKRSQTHTTKKPRTNSRNSMKTQLRIRHALFGGGWYTKPCQVYKNPIRCTKTLSGVQKLSGVQGVSLGKELYCRRGRIVE